MGKVMDFKMELLNTGIFKRVRNGQYRCKFCPYCDDSKFHMYVKIEMDEDSPVVFHCMKCVHSGRMNNKFLEYYGINNIVIPKYKGLRKIDSGKVGERINVELINKNDIDSINDVKMYINKRIGVECNDVELEYFQFISNPIWYANEYLTNKCLDTKWFEGENKRHWFKLSNGNMIGRNENDKDGWKRFISDRIKESGIYIIKLPFDPVKPIDVCISEGIFDSIGLYYHLKLSNGIFISVLGRDYSKALDYLINAGIFGDHVNIKIYKDADVDFVAIDKIKRRFFKHVEVYQNMIGKDYGLPINMIDIVKTNTL